MKQPEYLSGMMRVLILNELSRGENYGYGIAQQIGERSGGELPIKPESLYPVLHRMENDGLVKAHWIEAESGRPRKMYNLTVKGKKHWDRQRESFVAQSRGALKAIGEEPAGEMQ